jgi:hypothetical protein
MKWMAVSGSTHVVAIYRDDQTKDVGVRFHDGSEYVYRDVIEDDWDRLQGSGSKGRFVNIVLKRKYRYERIN